MTSARGQSFDHQFGRAQQINEALVTVSGIRAVAPDRSALELPVKQGDGAEFLLRVSLPPDFPDVPPELSLHAGPRGAVPSESVCRCLVGLEAPSTWGGGVRHLAPVIQAAAHAVSRFREVPPLGSAPRASESRVDVRGGMGTPGGAPGGTAAMMAPIPQEFPWLATLPQSELLRAVADPEAYRDLVALAAGHLNLYRPLTELRARNAELAQENLARRDEYSDAMNAIAIVRSSEYAPARRAFDEKYAQQTAVVRKLAPQVLMARLGEAAAVADAASEELLAAVQSGELGMDAFVEQYTIARTLFHMRDLKHQAALRTIPPHA